jgi:GTPase involved in cell partitioning and DNA repair
VEKYYVVKSNCMKRDRMRMLAERVVKRTEDERGFEIDLVADGERILVARGGRGGVGMVLF